MIAFLILLTLTVVQPHLVTFNEFIGNVFIISVTANKRLDMMKVGAAARLRHTDKNAATVTEMMTNPTTIAISCTVSTTGYTTTF